MIKKTCGTQKIAKMPDIRFAQVGEKAHLIPQLVKAGLDSRRNLHADCPKSQMPVRLMVCHSHKEHRVEYFSRPPWLKKFAPLLPRH
jgi:hypothetical protein